MPRRARLDAPGVVSQKFCVRFWQFIMFPNPRNYLQKFEYPPAIARFALWHLFAPTSLLEEVEALYSKRHGRAGRNTKSETNPKFRNSNDQNFIDSSVIWPQIYSLIQ